MPDVGLIRAGLAVNARGADLPFEFEVYDYEPDAANSPAVVVSLAQEADAITMGDGAFVFQFGVWLAVAAQDAETSDRRLDAMIVPVWRAIGADKTLGGAACSVRVLRYGARPEVDIGGITGFGGLYQVEVVA